MGSRVHGAASACLVASGLFLCGLGGALALAEPPPSPGIPGGSHLNEVQGKGPTAHSDGTDGKHDSDDKDETGKEETGKEETGTEETGYGGNPSNGNCGNDGSNGNAQHCGGGSSPSSPPTVTPPTTQTETETETSTTTSPPTSTTTQTTTTQTTTTETTTTTKTTTSQTTTPTTTTSLGLPPPGGGGGGGGGAVEVPSGRPELPPALSPPATEPSAIAAVPGVGAAAAQLPIPPITLPVIVAPVIGLGGGGGSPGAPALPVAPRGVTVEPPAGREPLPANVGSNVAVPAASYRIGYTEYLRRAGLSQVAALALPGVAGMLVLTGAGGLVGYRQAKAGHAVHTGVTARFVN